MKKRLVAMLLTVTMLFNTNGVAMAAEITEGNAQAEQAAEQNTANAAIEISTEQEMAKSVQLPAGLRMAMLLKIVTQIVKQ